MTSLGFSWITGWLCKGAEGLSIRPSALGKEIAERPDFGGKAIHAEAGVDVDGNEESHQRRRLFTRRLSRLTSH